MSDSEETTAKADAARAAIFGARAYARAAAARCADADAEAKAKAEAQPLPVRHCPCVLCERS